MHLETNSWAYGTYERVYQIKLSNWTKKRMDARTTLP